MSDKEGWFGLLSAVILTGAGIGAAFIWGYQLLTFAKSGYWVSLSVNDGMYWLTEQGWFLTPTSWLGIHQVLGFINAGWGLLIAAIIAMLGVAGLLDVSH
jgi:hypothetical protein